MVLLRTPQSSLACRLTSHLGLIPIEAVGDSWQFVFDFMGQAARRTLFWPYANYDLFDYVYWPYAYDDFWPYAYDDVYYGIYGPYAYSDSYRPYADPKRILHRQERA